MIKVFKVTAIAEGISYLVLFSNMLIVKNINLDLYKSFLFPIGMLHGLLFIAYLYLAFMIKEKMKWNMKDFAIILVCSVLPFGTFWMEKKYLANV